MADDELFNIQNLFWIGNWQGAINEAMSSSSVEELREELMYRSYVGMGNYDIVLDEISETSSSSLLAVRFLAKYFLEPKRNFSACLAGVDGLTATDTVSIVRATIYAHEGNYDDALKSLSELKSLDGLSMMTSCLVSIHQPDKAMEYVQRMLTIDEDAAITQLAHAWVSSAKGGADNLKEAFLIYQDLADKYGSSPLLLNGLAVCHMKNDRHEEAHSLLLESLEKNPNDADTLVNLIACTPFVVENPEKVATLRSRRVKQLNSITPKHIWLESLEKFDEQFEQLAASYSSAR